MCTQWWAWTTVFKDIFRFQTPFVCICVFKTPYACNLPVLLKLYGSLMRSPQNIDILIHLYINFFGQQFSNSPQSHIFETTFLYIPAPRLRKYLLRIVALPHASSNLYIHHICYSKLWSFVQQPASWTFSYLSNLHLLMLPYFYCRFATSKLHPVFSSLMGSIPVSRREEKYITLLFIVL